MMTASLSEPSLKLWTEEPAARAGHARIRARIGGLHCSLCTGTIEKALGRLPGVDKVAVSLTHEQALVEFDPRVVRAEELLQTLRDIGYTLHDPRKLRAFEEEERELVREGRRFLGATVASLAAIAFIANPVNPWYVAVDAIASISLAAFVVLVLWARGRAAALLALRGEGAIAPTAVPWIVGALALGIVFGLGRHFFVMAFQSVRRGILNQHVLLEAGALAGLGGGALGLALDQPGYPTAPFHTLRLVTRVVFDKTGTLTEGRPALAEIEPLGVPENDLLALAAAAESASEHPLAQVTVRVAFDRGLTPPEVARFEAVPGRGVVAEIDAKRVLVGNPRFLAESGSDLAPFAGRIAALESQGRTVIAVAADGLPRGLLAFADRVKPDAAEAVATLKRAGVTPLLVTGDNERAAHRIAAAVGIGEVHAGMLPAEKAELVRRLQRDTKVAMVGDGINDAPALMQADVGIAMGSGTDIAIDSADVVLLTRRLQAVASAREIGRFGYRKMVQNVCLAFLFNGIGVPLAATGLIYPVWAMAAMAASVTVIFFNSLWGQPRLFFDAILSVGRPIQAKPGAA